MRGRTVKSLHDEWVLCFEVWEGAPGLWFCSATGVEEDIVA